MMQARRQSVSVIRNAWKVHHGAPLALPLLTKQRCRIVKQLAFQRNQSTHYQSMMERGVFQEDAVKSTKNAKITTVDVANDGKVIAITFDDGHKTRFHSEWLRHMCFCSACRADYTGQLFVDYREIPDNLRLTSVKMDGDSIVLVEWNDDKNHVGIFPVSFLRKNCYDTESKKMRRKKAAMKFYNGGPLPKVDYKDVMETEDGLYRWLAAIDDYGFSLINNVPAEVGYIQKVIERIGPMQPSSYGTLFNVKEVEKPTNETFSANRLRLHQDMPYYSAQPGLQLFHCVRFDDDVTGGESIIADMFYIAEQFRQHHPEDFETLTRVPGTWCDIHYGRKIPVEMWYRRPHFVLNDEGDLIQVCWNPIVHGPLFVKEEDVEPYYKAYRKLAAATEDKKYQFEYRLKPGDMLTVNNRRMMHARTSFQGKPGQRFLQSAFVQIDDFKSRLQVLSNLVGDASQPRKVGNLDQFL